MASKIGNESLDYDFSEFSGDKPVTVIGKHTENAGGVSGVELRTFGTPIREPRYTARPTIDASKKHLVVQANQLADRWLLDDTAQSDVQAFEGTISEVIREWCRVSSVPYQESMGVQAARASLRLWWQSLPNLKADVTANRATLVHHVLTGFSPVYERFVESCSLADIESPDELVVEQQTDKEIIRGFSAEKQPTPSRVKAKKVTQTEKKSSTLQRARVQDFLRQEAKAPPAVFDLGIPGLTESPSPAVNYVQVINQGRKCRFKASWVVEVGEESVVLVCDLRGKKMKTSAVETLRNLGPDPVWVGIADAASDIDDIEHIAAAPVCQMFDFGCFRFIQFFLVG